MEYIWMFSSLPFVSSISFWAMKESKGEGSECCTMLIECVIKHYNLFWVNWTSFNYSSPPMPDFTLAHLVSEIQAIRLLHLIGINYMTRSVDSHVISVASSFPTCFWLAGMYAFLCLLLPGRSKHVGKELDTDITQKLQNRSYNWYQ